jgi:isopenicillin-N epimerase
MNFGRDLLHRWLIDENIHYLNHGSFGACPRDVLVAQSEWRTKMEQQGVYFFTVEAPKQLAVVKEKLSEFLGAKNENIVFVENATSAINAVVRSLMPSWQKGDELLTTTHVYGAMRQTLHYASDVMGTKVIEAVVPFPINDPSEVVDVIKRSITDRTRFALIDHITSPTGLVYPIEQIIPLFKERGIPVLIDGAHAPGNISLEVEKLGADFYTGNCHKWMFGPKGSAFLWTSPLYQPKIHAHIISHNYKQGYHPEFEWIGTRDLTPFLALDASLSFIKEFGAENIRNYNRGLALNARSMLAKKCGTTVLTPDSMIASMAVIALPKHLKGDDPLTGVLHDRLRDEYHCELPVIVFGDTTYLRISAQIYNDMSDYDQLAAAILNIFRK